MLKVNITKIKAHVDLHIGRRGSVLAGTVEAFIPKVATTYQIESPDEDSKVANVIRNARNGCFVRAALKSPVPVEDSITLNGRDLAL